MANIKCKNCNAEMSYQDAKCRSCGFINSNPNAITKGNAIGGLIAAAIALWFITGGNESPSKPEPVKDATAPIAAPAPVTQKDTLPSEDKQQIVNNLQTIAKALEENANQKKFLKSINAKSIEIKAETENISKTDFGGIRLTIYVKDESMTHIENAKALVNTIIDKYKADTGQDVIFNISAQLFSDTKVQQIKHYFARVKYLPKISPTVEADTKDHLVNIRE
jgi:predicted Zn-ribbon and HTH transcriptional regulator